MSEMLLGRIADALDRAYPEVAAIPLVSELFGDPKADPVGFVMNLWGETRADAEAVVATTLAQDDVTDQPA